MYLRGKCEIVTAPEVGIHENKVGHRTNSARLTKPLEFQWYVVSDFDVLAIPRMLEFLA